MTSTIVVAFRPKKKLESDIAIKSEIRLASEEKPTLGDVNLKKDTKDIVETKTELKDEKGLITSGQQYAVTYKYGSGKTAVEETVTGTIADPKGVSYLAIDI
jgi:hypothetical protein